MLNQIFNKNNEITEKNFLSKNKIDIYYEGFIYEEKIFNEFILNNIINKKKLLGSDKKNIKTLYYISIIIIFSYLIYSINLLNKNIKSSELKLKSSLLLLQEKILDNKINNSVENIFLEEKINNIIKKNDKFDNNLNVFSKKITLDLVILYKKLEMIENQLNKKKEFLNTNHF